MNLRLPRIILIPCLLVLTCELHSEAQEKKKPVTKEPENQNPLATNFKYFSANVTGGIANDQGRKIYRSGNWMRLDFDGEYRLTDLKTLKMWGVGRDRCFAFARPDAGTFPFTAYHDFNAERSMTQEEETVDGHLCKIENVTFTPRDGGPLVVKMKLWEAKDLQGFPIKIVVDTGMRHPITSTYTNINLTPPDPKLFQHPTKCTMGPQPGQKGTVAIPRQPAKSDTTVPEKGQTPSTPPR